MLSPCSQTRSPALSRKRPRFQPGLHLFGLFAADGSPILITDSREAALVNARDSDLTMVSLH